MPFGLPDPTTIDARERFQKAAEKEAQANTQALAQAGLLINANLALKTLVNGLPPPINIGVKTLSEGIYTALKAKTFPIDLERAKAQLPIPPPPATQQDMDPIKLFAIMIAFAIIQALWCFIKSILHPLPIIGWFFSLCNDEQGIVIDQPKIKDREGNLVDDNEQLALNKANKDFVESNKADEGSVPSTPTPEAFSPPPPSRGKTFNDFMAENYPSTQNNNSTSSGDPNLVPSARTTQANSANIQQPSDQQGTEITIQLGNLSSDDARRLFGL